jgi:hypothetical protein
MDDVPLTDGEQVLEDQALDVGIAQLNRLAQPGQDINI